MLAIWRPSNLEEIWIPSLILEQKHCGAQLSDTKIHFSFILGSTLLVIWVDFINIHLSHVTCFGHCSVSASIFPLGTCEIFMFFGLFFFFSLRASILGVTDFISLQPVSLFILQRNAYFFFWVASCYLVSSSCEIWKHSSNLCPLIKKCVDFQWK